jgi:formyl-CoA transferase
MVAAAVPVSRAFSIADIAADPHYAARQDIVTVDDPTAGPLKQPAVYPRLSATPGRVQRGAPLLGEHNDEVYGDLLGLSSDEIALLRAERVI